MTVLIVSTGFFLLLLFYFTHLVLGQTLQMLHMRYPKFSKQLISMSLFYYFFKFFCSIFKLMLLWVRIKYSDNAREVQRAEPGYAESSNNLQEVLF